MLKIKLNVYLIVSLLYMGLIFCVSSYSMPVQVPSFSFLDKLLHVFEYGILASLIYLALRDTKATKYHLLGLGFAISFLYGILDEIHQYFVPGRDADIFDVMADGIGSLCFPLALHFKTHYQNSRSEVRKKYGIASPSQSPSKL